MGGYGSGRYGYGSDRRCTVEESLTIDVGELRRRGAIEPGSYYSGGLRWSRGGRESGAIRYTVDLRAGAVPVLVLRYQIGKGEKVQRLEYPVELVTTAPRFGGVRWWFRCPLVVNGQPCGRRVAKIHLPPGAKYFGCRTCHGLTYQSCQESHKWDALYKSLAAETGYDPGLIRWALKQRGVG